MTNTKITLAVALAAVVSAITGCTSTDFTPYAGAQQNWPTASGAFVSSKYVIPVYQGPPARPYMVLGYVEAATSAGTGDYRTDAINAAARRAKGIGGDAIIVQSNGSDYAGTYSTGGAVTSGNYSGNVTGTAVGPNVIGTVSGMGYSTTSGWGINAPLSRGRATVLVIKFK
jgi:hypothetical protein